ncbi:hypothetical protein ACGVWS_06000 [Enterobacteriaceae bacterium LUAb1]
MSGNTDTIKDFLVSLGFDIDQAGANKFEAVLKGVTANVLKVGAVVEGAALNIVGFTTQIANGLDKIYWASQRTGASVQGIKALGYAASQTDASAESAMSSLEGLAGFMRSNPGAEGFLNRLGAQTRDASGKMRDTATIFTGVGQKLNNMPYYRAKQYAQMLGIDENTLMAMQRGMNGFTTDYQSMLQKTGFNADKVAERLGKSLGTLWDKLEPLVKEFGELISLDFSKFSAKSLFDSLTNSITNSIKVLSHLVDALKKVTNGDFSGAFDSLKIAGGIMLDSVKDTIGGGIYSILNDKISHYLLAWAGGAADYVWSGNEPEQHAQSAKHTLADRNSNSGNIRPVGGKGFRFFKSALHGWEAMKKQLMRYFTGKTTGRTLQTIQDIVSTWAPAGDNNDPKKYAQDVAKWMGVSPNAVLNLNNLNTMGTLVQSMARKEGYGDWNSPLAYRAVGGNTHTNSIQQETTINIHGVSDPREAARLTVDRQKGVNSQLTQQLPTGPR